jgi:Ribosomal protein S5, C-terminal domain
MYPKASGRGIKASSLMKALCQLAGIQDVGIKIQVLHFPGVQAECPRAIHDVSSSLDSKASCACAPSYAHHLRKLTSDHRRHLQGSRNLRNSVQALFKAFDQMQTRVDEDSVDSKPYHELPSRFHMDKPVPPQIPGMENFDWDRLIEKVLVEVDPAQLQAEEAQEQQAATA